MTHSQNTEQLLKELNDLIIRTKETALFTGKSKLEQPAAALYSDFLDSVIDRTEAIAEDLQGILKRISDIPRCPDEISNRFLLMRTMEDTTFRSYVLSLQVGLTVSRAQPAHREAFRPICDRYRSFAKDAEVKVDKLVAFYKELVSLIFSDMRENAKQLLQTAVEKGTAAASILTSNKEYPYAYLADEITRITDTLSALPFDEVMLSLLEDCKFQLDVISSTADIDAIRTPSHKQLFDSILVFRESITEAAEFFQLLSATLTQTRSEAETPSPASDSLSTSCKTRAWKINILLFFLKGELQKLGDSRLNTEQRTAFDTIYHELGLIIQNIETASTGSAFSLIDETIKDTHNKLIVQADNLGVYGSAIQYLAEELIVS